MNAHANKFDNLDEIDEAFEKQFTKTSTRSQRKSE